MDDLISIAKSHNVKVNDCGNGHIQLIGKLIVNYYPESKKKTAYIAGTKGSAKRVTPLNAVLMAINKPMNPTKKEARKKQYKGSKNKLFKNSKKCHWCKIELTKETMTLDHVIPLALGGLNNMNNYVLACEKCNNKRGSKMPEMDNEQSR